jgi:hypothetical protein
LSEIAEPARKARIPNTLPVYVFRSSKDPVGGNIDQLLAAYDLIAWLKAVV